MSERLFLAVAAKDYDELVNFYASKAIFILRSCQHPHRYGRVSSREEKTDDLYSQLTRPPENSPNRRRYRSFSSPNNKKNASAAAPAGYGDLLRDFSIFLNHPEAAAAGPTRTPTVHAERVVYDAMRAASDSRPPANFVLYPNGFVVTTSNNTDEEETSSTTTGEDDDDNNADTTPPPPNLQPVFDGSVANATPGGSGGAGTVLHAATALDHPLTLAFLLSMNADTRACHTAFRRLVVHEAACNGSVDCLTLILEIGTKFGQELTMAAVERHLAPSSSSSSLLDGKERSPKTAAAKKSKQMSNNMETLSILRHFRELTQQVESGLLSELDAARQLLQKATLTESSKVALAKQCGYFQVPPDIMIRSSTVVRSSLHSSADGHGNTPLHWAAFKNETACVSLLLKYKMDPNARAHPSGWTPLHDAAYSNGSESIALLVDAGAFVDSKANSGATPLCFASQENAAGAAELLLIRGADMTLRCCPTTSDAPGPTPQSRFSGYTPLHYCAHYNASKAAMALLTHRTARAAMEIRDLNERLPIHVAVARGSSDVLRELLRAGARVETRSKVTPPVSPVRPPPAITTTPGSETTSGSAPGTATPVSSPMLRSMIPSQPVQSSKPWNCLSQRSIDECRQLIAEVEQNWTPDRHSLFTPADRRAVAELLKVGKRLELDTIIFSDVWPEVLSFCGRGWFEAEDETETEVDILMEDDSLALPSLCW